MKKVINVTARDIEKGSRAEPESCPVARALSRAFRSQAIVGTRDVDFNDGSLKTIFLPADAVRFILDFDRGRPVRPFKFEVYIND